MKSIEKQLKNKEDISSLFFLFFDPNFINAFQDFKFIRESIISINVKTRIKKPNCVTPSILDNKKKLNKFSALDNEVENKSFTVFVFIRLINSFIRF